MKRYATPFISITSVDAGDILTVSVGNGNTATLDLTKDFFEGVIGSGTGNATSVSWSEMS